MITGGVSPQSRAVLLIVSSSQPSSLRFDLLSSQKSHIMLLGDSHPPHACSTLSPCRDSFTIVRSRSNPNLQGSLTGAPFNCLVQAAAAEGKMTALKAFAFLFTSSSHCCHSLSTHARIPVLLTAAGSLSSHARLIYPSLSNVIQIDSLHFKKKKKR